MKPVPHQEVERIREYFRSRGFPEERGEFGRTKFTYFVSDPEVYPSMKNFAFSMPSLYQGRGRKHIARDLYGISREVPRILRPLLIGYETVDMGEGSGLQTMAFEMALAMHILTRKNFTRYLKFRSRFFSEVVDDKECFRPFRDLLSPSEIWGYESADSLIWEILRNDKQANEIREHSKNIFRGTERIEVYDEYPYCRPNRYWFSFRDGPQSFKSP